VNSVFTHLLTILAFAAHVLGGCCAHHVHAHAHPVASEHGVSEHCCASEPCCASEHSASEHSASEHSASEHSASEHSASEHSAGEHSAGEHGAGEHGAGNTGETERCPLHSGASQQRLSCQHQAESVLCAGHTQANRAVENLDDGADCGSTPHDSQQGEPCHEVDCQYIRSVAPVAGSFTLSPWQLPATAVIAGCIELQLHLRDLSTLIDVTEKPLSASLRCALLQRWLV